MATEFIFIRHGQAERQAGDYTHAPLTALGREQAALTGKHLQDIGQRLDGFYSSPIRRASETAALIGAEIEREPVLTNGLQEIHPFEFPSLVFLESSLRWLGLQAYLDSNAGKSVRWPIVGRVSTVLSNLISGHPAQTIAIVTHGEVVSGTLVWYMPKERRRWWRETVANCSLTCLRVDGCKAELIAFNEIGHLAPHIATENPSQTFELREVNPTVGKAAADTLGRL